MACVQLTVEALVEFGDPSSTRHRSRHSAATASVRSEFFEIRLNLARSPAAAVRSASIPDGQISVYKRRSAKPFELLRAREQVGDAGDVPARPARSRDPALDEPSNIARLSTFDDAAFQQLNERIKSLRNSSHGH
jgi:hypothetical protein